jgi:hypothetical protein
MPFDWYRSGPNAAKASGKHVAGRDRMYVTELEEKAAMLLRLGYDREHAKMRLRANVSWEFELHRKPALAARIDQIVEAVYSRGGRAGGEPTP